MPTKPTSETPDAYGAYPRLTLAQLAALGGLGQRREVPPGDALFAEGERHCDFFVILAGTVAVVEARGTSGEQVLSVHGRGRFLGEVGLLTGQAALYSAVATQAARVLAVPVARLQALVATDPALGDLILRAYLIRRSILISLGVGVRIIGSRYSPDARRLRDFAARNRIPARWLDLETDPDAEEMISQLGVAPEDTPLVILFGRRLLRNPGNAELARALGLPAPAASEVACGLLVVGSGPAGLSAAVYGASEGLETVVIDGVATGGQAATSSRIENYLGFPSGISGGELAERAEIQARKFGARFAVPAEAAAITQRDGRYTVGLADGASVTAAAVVIATGARYRRLDVPRLAHFERSSVYYAASEAEAQLCRDDPVAVVGGGNSAGQAVIFLAARTPRVSLIARERDLSEHMSRYLISQIDRLAGAEVLLHTEVRELLGDQTLDGVVVVDNQDGARRTVPARALFVFIGATPCTGWLGGLVDLDDGGFVRTGPDARPPCSAAAEPGWRPSLLETSRPGMFAVGDVRSGSAKRVAAAVGEGAMAVRLAHERIRPLP
ncbi:MAG TPA: FAD-dependent oxidoreductase [Streptosporangiaceae bacterium]|jgi:thioredoxin reductase (NADPH)|nr:FAD-dependent oxidoreductase [Streptosporangiaceae bacterium]